MDRLMALRAFARVVELGRFSRKRETPQLSKTTVSDLVQGLEKHLGVRLLQRTTRRVTVTADVPFYERWRAHPCGSRRGRGQVMQARVAPRGRLRVDMPGGLASFSSFHDWRHSSAAIPSCDWSGDGASAVDLLEGASIVSCASACSRTRAWSHDESVR